MVTAPNAPELSTGSALILVPSPSALVQDLGPFRTGQQMETDILPKSALVCFEDAGNPLLSEGGFIEFAFEGNANSAANLRRYHERCIAAAGRLATRAPSIAYGIASPEEIIPVARMDLLRYVITDILDADLMEEWSGELVSSIIPPSDIPTPFKNLNAIPGFYDLPMKALAQGEKGIFAWSLMDGSILTAREKGSDQILWKPGDPGLNKILESAGIDFLKRMMLTQKLQTHGNIP